MARIMRAKSAEFKLHAPQAKKVSLVGTFNNWDTRKLSAKKDSRGNWEVEVNLKPGKYEYKFFVDGSWLNDPNCTYRVPNNMGTENCVVEIK